MRQWMGKEGELTERHTNWEGVREGGRGRKVRRRTVRVHAACMYACTCICTRINRGPQLPRP